jgi:hypothetical protein
MASFTNVVEIDRPAHDVFAFLADLENVPEVDTRSRRRGRHRPASRTQVWRPRRDRSDFGVPGIRRINRATGGRG